MRIILVTFILLLTIVGATARAELITIGYSGVLTRNEILEGPDQGDPLTALALDTLIEGHYTYDTSTIDVNSDDRFGDFNNAIVSMAFSFAGLDYTFSLTAAGTSRVSVEDNTSTAYSRDRYSAIARESLSGPRIGDFSLTYFQLDVFDFEDGVNPDLISGDDLPLVAPDLSLVSDAAGLGLAELQSVYLQFQQPLGGPRAVIEFQIEDISTVRVPEPGTLGLFLAGIAGMGFASRRRQSV